MMKVAKKYGVELENAGLPREAMMEMPLWYHIGADPNKKQLNRSNTAKCLQENHKIFKVKEAIAMMQRLSEGEHYPESFCRCDACSHDKDELGCRNPHKCAMAAADRL
ncbi:hypothetical protein F5880DRAFT_1452795, partial [Lentinula raphanica]